MTNDAALPLPLPAASHSTLRIMHAAWFGVALGLLIESLLLGLQAWQAQLPDAIRIAADTVQKLSWSALVCAALAAGQTAARQRIAMVGVYALVSVPVVFLLARALHKALVSLLGGPEALAATDWLGAGIKGIEYALLGMAALWLARRDAGWALHAALGIAVGTTTWLLTWWWLPAGGNTLQYAVVEILHPAGCTLALYVSLLLGKQLDSHPVADA